MLVADDPDQSAPSDSKAWEVKGYTIRPLADYRIRARVLMTERYFLGRESDLSPIDFTLGWRQMSNQKILDEIALTRERRAFCYRPKRSDFPIPAGEVNAQCANMHLIPANPEIERGLRAVNEGDIIELRGSLVEVQGSGWVALAQFADAYGYGTGSVRADVGDGTGLFAGATLKGIRGPRHLPLTLWNSGRS